MPTWAVIECTPSGEPVFSTRVPDLIGQLEDAGVEVVLFEVASIAHGVNQLRLAADAMAPETAVGVLLAGGNESVRGFPDSDSVPAPWARDALDLDANGARVIGGGAGTTEGHTAALAQELGELHPSLPIPGPV